MKKALIVSLLHITILTISGVAEESFKSGMFWYKSSLIFFSVYVIVGILIGNKE